MAAYGLTIRPLRLRIRLTIEQIRQQPRENQSETRESRQKQERHLTQYNPTAMWQASSWRR